MRPYIIYAPSYTPKSGGIIVLHKLALILKSLGYRAYMWPWQELWDGYQTMPGTDLAYRGVLSENPIVVYPETVPLNPLGVPEEAIVRWILFTVPKNWGCKPHGKWIFFSPFFAQEQDITPDAFMHLIHFPTSLDKFQDLGLPRKPICYTLRKSNVDQLPPEVLAGTLIRGDEDMEWLIHVFQTHTYFYSYDAATFLCPLASLCGCRPVVAVQGVSRGGHNFRIINSQPSLKYGVAEGLDNLQWAHDTAHLVRPWLIELEAQGWDDVKRFIQMTQ